jgi:hypothetical protein
MELSEVWAPTVSAEEVEEYGILLDEQYDPHPSNNKEKITCKLYYVKSRDLFVMARITGYYSVITSQMDTDELRSKYLNQKVERSKDNFAEFNGKDYVMYEPDFITTQIDQIKQFGVLLEIDTALNEIYYIASADMFVYLPPSGELPYRLESVDLRKKYKIPYQDERFSSFS